MKKFSNWIINKYSYIQIFIFISILFFISSLPISLYWIKTHVELVQAIKTQLNSLEEVKKITHLLNLIDEHRLLTFRYYTDPKNEGILQKIQNTQEQINIDFQIIKDFTFNNNGKDLVATDYIWREVFPFQFQKNWIDIVDKFSTRNQRENESAQTILIQNLNTLFDYLVNEIGISYFKQRIGFKATTQIDRYVFIQSLFYRLPSFQENISQLLLISEKILSSQSQEISRDRGQALIDALKSDINYFNIVLNAYTTHEDSEASLEDDKEIYELQYFFNSTDKIIQLIETQILSTPNPSINLAEFQTTTQDILSEGIKTWNLCLDIMITVFSLEKKIVFFRLFFILSITLVLTGFAFFLGLTLTRTGVSRLLQLTQATNNFTNGDLSARVPNIYEDEIGQQAKAFNRMAYRLEEIVNHLNDLIEAIKALAKGNLSTRIPTRDDNSDFDNVAHAFNIMAEKFETIIGRPKQIGLMLTSSASEIASASKEQEIIIIEQEATTREIATAASEISSTAKEFANTMNEVSQAAEQTSSLALKGKDSLTNMESIMRNMVDASSKIASKLAVLNDKAGNITSVITTITKVADQTNLLSLNASIEAEKAGEYGRSFAVIAREIRRLADQTAIATLDIEKMINEIMTAVSSTVMGVDDFTQEIRKGGEQVKTVSDQLATIIEQVQNFTARFDLVNQGMQAQSTGAEQINEAIEQLSQTARHTTEAIHQFRRTVQELNRAANELSILNPFAAPSSSNIPSDLLNLGDKPILEPAYKDSKIQFRKTLSHLSDTAGKLKNSTKQHHPESSEGKGN